MKILIVGRGPSAITTPIDYDLYDLVIRLKQCRPGKANNEKCDIVVFNDLEVHTMPHQYDVCKHLSTLKEIWFINPKELSLSRKDLICNDPRIKNKLPIIQMNNEAIHSRVKIYGFKQKEYPRVSTGLACIIETINKYTEDTIYIAGFDNLVDNVDVGEYDNPDRKNGWPSSKSGLGRGHDLNREHQVIKTLITQERIYVLKSC
jgi:hypothetical protein